VKENEKLKLALIRELKEEFNIDIKIEKLLFKIKNRDCLEFYFLVKNFKGNPKISGDEKERMSKNNQYFPTWLNLKKATKLSNLYPEKAKQKVEMLIKND